MAANLIRYDFCDALIGTQTQANFAALRPALEAAWREVKETDLRRLNGKEPTPSDRQPLDAAFFELPEKLLNAFRSNRESSELGRLLAAARQLQEQVDRVVVLGIGGSYMGARALMDALCEPYFNEQSRAARGSKPRMYFEGNNVDNDATDGLLRLLGNGNVCRHVDDRWGIVVISKSGGTMETAASLRIFVDRLRSACGGDDELLRSLIVPVTGTQGKLYELSKALGKQDGELFEVPDGVGGRFSILSAVGLLPAAVLGIDVVQLLEGAAAMNQHFRTADPAKNIVLQYVGVCNVWEQQGATTRVLQVWSKALEAVGLWYDQLLAESLGKQGRGATPLTAVNTRDLHSRAQQHQEGSRDKLYHNVIVDQWRTDPIAIGKSELDQDKLNDLADKTLPDIMSAAIAGTNQAYRDDGRPTANIHLPQVDAYTLGQLFQMLMLATVVEGRLIGINPYGQPGVELYKRNMNRLLGRS